MPASHAMGILGKIAPCDENLSQNLSHLTGGSWGVVGLGGGVDGVGRTTVWECPPNIARLRKL